MKSFAISNDTQVNITEPKKTVKLSDLLNVACLTVSNSTGRDIGEVTYAGTNVGTIGNCRNKEILVFNFDNMPDHISFSIARTASDAPVEFKTKDKISIEKNERKSFSIGESTLMLKDMDDTPYVVGDFIKGVATLEIESGTYISLKWVTFGGKLFVNGDFGRLEPTNVKVTNEYEEDINDYIRLEAGPADIRARIPFKLSVGQRKKYTFRGDNDVEVLLDPLLHGAGATRSEKLSELGSYTELSFLNRSYDLSEFKCGDVISCQTVTNGKLITEVFPGSDPNAEETYEIKFKVFSKRSNSFISVKMVKLFTTKRCRTNKYYIEKDSKVIREDNGQEVTLRSLVK